MTYALLGFLVGALVGMTGMGGGALMTPVLMIFGIHPVTAVGSDLCYACITKAAGSFFHWRNKSVDWHLVGWLACGSVPATIVALAILYKLGVDSSITSTLGTRVLAFSLLLTAAALVFDKHVGAYPANWVAARSPRALRLLTLAAGVLLGFLVSISSVGAGALGVSVLTLLYPKRRIATIIGSDIAHAVPLTFISGLGHWLLGSVDVMLVAQLLAGSLPGVFLGSQFTQRVPERRLRVFLGTMLVVISIMILSRT